MRYLDFINELRELLAQADVLMNANATHSTREFRAWRHHVESLVAEASAHGYRLPGTFSSPARAYRALYAYATEKDEREEFRSDLNDTAIELRYLIDQYDKYGQPPLAVSDRSSTVGPATPGEVTLAWLFTHVPVRLWWSAGSVAVVLILIGVGLGQTEASKSAIDFLKRLVGWQ